MRMSDLVKSPVEAVASREAPDDGSAELRDELALCLSGGGYRAMMFHVGAILRLNDLGALARLRRVASVSGGSVTAATLGKNWSKLAWDAPRERVRAESLTALLVEPIRHLARQTIDLPAIGWGAALPWHSISESLQAAYAKHLLGESTLQDFPDERAGSGDTPSAPRFVMVATNVKTGSLWRFSKPYMADYRVGIVDRPSVPLAAAVAASSAFPPFLSPMRMDLRGCAFRPGVPREPVAPPLREEAVLTDGGVYDNLGLEAVWKQCKTVLISDAGRRMPDDLAPAGDWLWHSRRLMDLLQHQTSSLRRRQAIAAFRDETEPHKGTYWGIQTLLADYRQPDALPCPPDRTAAIAAIDTRLAALSDSDQERIMNWGYAVCDAAMRCYVDDFKSSPAPAGFPFPATGLG